MNQEDRPKKSRYACAHPECFASVEAGDAIYRTSQMGQAFEGMCRKHHPGPLDPIVLDISETIASGGQR